MLLIVFFILFCCVTINVYYINFYVFGIGFMCMLLQFVVLVSFVHYIPPFRPARQLWLFTALLAYNWQPLTPPPMETQVTNQRLWAETAVTPQPQYHQLHLCDATVTCTIVYGSLCFSSPFFSVGLGSLFVISVSNLAFLLAQNGADMLNVILQLLQVTSLGFGSHI